jgi:hypothetical protein
MEHVDRKDGSLSSSADRQSGQHGSVCGGVVLDDGVSSPAAAAAAVFSSALTSTLPSPNSYSSSACFTSSFPILLSTLSSNIFKRCQMPRNLGSDVVLSMEDSDQRSLCRMVFFPVGELSVSAADSVASVAFARFVAPPTRLLSP